MTEKRSARRCLDYPLEMRKNQKKFKVFIDGKDTRIVERTKGPDSLSLVVEMLSPITPAKSTLSVSYGNKPIEPHSVTMPYLLSEPGEQPEIAKIDPEGGKEGDTITIVGKNLVALSIGDLEKSPPFTK